MRSVFGLSIILAMVYQARALNIVFGPPLGNITASQLFPAADSTLGNSTQCQPSCGTALSAIQACGDTNDVCLCSNATISPLVECEQCMFTEMINLNVPQPNPVAGSQPALTAYAAACLASQNITIPASDIALELPANWDGPKDLVLNLGETIITVGMGGALGFGALYLLSTL